MSVTVKKKNKLVSGAVAAHPMRGATPKVYMDPKQVEMCGRFRMTRAHMAAWFRVPVTTIDYHMSKPEVLEAYNYGAAQTVVAVRQKQLSMALGNEEKGIAPDRDMLKHVGRHMADQEERLEVSTTEAAGVSWVDAAREQAQAIRARLVDVSGSGAGGGE